jgi:hypothetical protein
MPSSPWTHSLHISRHPQLEATGKTFLEPSASLICPSDTGRAFTVMSRSKRHVWYYWPPDSDSLDMLFTLCQKYDFKTDAPSWSRLSKHIFRTFVSEDKSNIRPHPNFEFLATSKWHWHNFKYVPGVFANVTEIDVKSAYTTAILKHPSIYLKRPFHYEDDKGAMNRLAALIPQLEKKLRLVLIGWLSAGRMRQFIPDPARPFMLKCVEFQSYYDGGVFNLIHCALKELWDLMQELGEVAPEYTPRVHTDSLWIDECIPDNKLKSLLYLLDTRGYNVGVKGHGKAVIWELNTAVLGGRIVGIPSYTLPMFDEYAKAVGAAAFDLKEIDKRLRHLPYKNERLSVRQGREVLKYTQQQIAEFAKVRGW